MHLAYVYRRRHGIYNTIVVSHLDLEYIFMPIRDTSASTESPQGQPDPQNEDSSVRVTHNSNFTMPLLAGGIVALVTSLLFSRAASQSATTSLPPQTVVSLLPFSSRGSVLTSTFIVCGSPYVQCFRSKWLLPRFVIHAVLQPDEHQPAILPSIPSRLLDCFGQESFHPRYSLKPRVRLCSRSTDMASQHR